MAKAKAPAPTQFHIQGFQLANGGNFDTAKDVAPDKTERHTKHIEILIALGKDHTATLTFDEDAIAANPDIFVPITKENESDFAPEAEEAKE